MSAMSGITESTEISSLAESHRSAPALGGRNRRAKTRVPGVAIGCIVLLAVACHAPPQHVDRSARSAPLPKAEVKSWRQYKVGPHTGFIKEVSAPGGSNQVVYDDEMRRIGYYTPMGATYRTPPGKESELLGTYDAASSLRALYGIQDLSVPVQHLPMPPRMTLEDLDKQAEESP